MFILYNIVLLLDMTHWLWSFDCQDKRWSQKIR